MHRRTVPFDLDKLYHCDPAREAAVCAGSSEIEPFSEWKEAISLLTVLGRYPGEMSADAISAHLRFQAVRDLAGKLDLPGAAHDGIGRLIVADDDPPGAVPKGLASEGAGFDMLAAGDLLLVAYDLTANPPSARRDRRPKKLVEAELPHAFRSGSADAATPRHLLSGSWLQGHVQNVLTHSGTGIANELRVNGGMVFPAGRHRRRHGFVHGGEDRMSPVEPIADLVNRLPQVRLDVVIDAGQLLCPDRFDRVLDAAWSRR